MSSGECAALISDLETGACVSYVGDTEEVNDCNIITKEQCSDQFTFFSGITCTDPAVGSWCNVTNTTICDGDDVIAEYRDVGLFAQYVFDDAIDRPLHIAAEKKEHWYHKK